MNKFYAYEQFKKYLYSLNLTPEEYQRLILEYCRSNNL
jgi:hypothetical protein